MTSADDTPLILIVDDDPTVRIIARETLLSAGYRVDYATNGSEALESFQSNPPDLILLDLDMPGIDGFTVCKTLREELHSQVPVFIITGSTSVSSVHAAYKSGATDFIRKPVNWPTIPYRVAFALETRQLQDELHLARQHTHSLLAAIPDEIFLLRADGTVQNQTSEQRQGDGKRPGTGRTTIENTFPPDVARAMRENLNFVFSTDQPTSFEYALKDGEEYREARLLPRPDEQVLAIIRNVTGRQRDEARIRQLAYYDSITGLPNRQYFVRELRRAMRHAQRDSNQVAILYVDLDRFKRINDTFGHSVGDSLLKSVADRIANCLRSIDSIATSARTRQSAPETTQLARFGGDEFVVLVADLETEEQALAVANRILDTLQDPFDIDGRNFVMTPSIGISVFPQHGHDVETLLMRADMAMYEAKSSRNTIRAYTSDMDAGVAERMRLESDLRHAIESGQFCLNYQPKHDLQTGRIAGAEALLRWLHPVRGWIPPSEFILLAEEVGLIESLGKLVIEKACWQIRDWQDREIPVPTIAINISAEQVLRSDVADTVIKSAWQHGIRPQSLEVELTETVLMQDIQRAEKMLAKLKKAEIEVAIDDFGTGYSSLSYVRQFPIDTLKIDRGFVCNLHQDKDAAAICGAIIAMARQLGIKVVAEGVELEEQRDFLARTGCNQAQGFLYSRPMTAEDFEKFLLAEREDERALVSPASS